MGCCCRACEICTVHGESSGSCVLLQDRFDCIGKLGKGGRRHQAEAEKSWEAKSVPVSAFVASPNTTGPDFHFICETEVANWDVVV